LNKFFLVALLTISFVACTPQSVASTATALPVTPTSTATFTPTETSTPEIVPTSTSTTKPTPVDILNSPNGEFVVEFDNAYSHPAFEPQVIKILDKNGSLLWEIPYQHETAMVDPHPGMSIYGWSKDSSYLYFYYYFSPDGGDRAFWWDGFDLQRINVQTGEIEQVIPGDKESFVAFAFSPDETHIAYTRAQDNPSIFYIRNLATGVEKTANVIITSMNYIRVGSIVWSPSGDKIAFQTESDDYVAQTIYLDPSTMKQQVVREYMVDTSYFDGWSDDENLVFLDIKGGKGYIVHLNLKSGEIVEIGTPTPQP
jgi:WD40 repeat protein